MNVIVTGVAGFIGSHVAEMLVGKGCRVLGIDDLSGGFRENLPTGVDFQRRSVTEPLDDLFSAFRPEVVYHLAAYAAEGLSHHIPLFNYQNNLVGTANVLAAGYRAGIRHFVFTSSIAAYGHPPDGVAFDERTSCRPCDPYGIAKFACEQHIEAFYGYFGAPTYTIYRPHNVFGPRQNISDPYRNAVGIFMKRALENKPMPIFGDGSQTRSFSYVTSVARCIAEAAFTPEASNAVFNVGGDEVMSVLELAQRVAAIMGVNEKVQFLAPRKEVYHAHCRHERAGEVFPSAFEEKIDIATGLDLMASYVKSHPVPPATECPCPVEIYAELPQGWGDRLGVAAAKG